MRMKVTFWNNYMEWIINEENDLNHHVDGHTVKGAVDCVC